ncbi:MAG: TPM domain-containing protein [Candidatus Caenarcaniphilales bacterium]|nr:TPM domain-containing protein [Candidatus Caenarcaniphilales bacterium]
MKDIERFLSNEEQELIAQKIDEIEALTDAELRVHVESRCKVDPVKRAAKVFHELKMDGTKERNGVLFYIAVKDHKLAVWGDEGIDNELGQSFWEEEIEILVSNFKEAKYFQGLILAIDKVADKLKVLYPFTGHKNELCNQISLGE